ncbi:MAG: GDSL-type esterase/lipase family protein [Pirellula sp.]|jgi:hypothetical protein
MLNKSILTYQTHHHTRRLATCYSIIVWCLLCVSPSNSNAQEKSDAKAAQNRNELHTDFLSKHGLTVYAEAAQKWNEDVEKLASQNPSESNSEAILFIGSSTIRLWDSVEHDVAPYAPIKRGYGGAKLCDLAIHCPHLIEGLKYRAVVVFVANDITGGVSDKEPAEIKRLARITIESLKANAPAAPVVFLSITATPSRFAHWKRIQSANRAISTLANEMPGVYFLETEKKYLTEDGKPIDKYFVEDRLHQTPEGYKLLGSLVKSKLDEVLSVKSNR